MSKVNSSVVCNLQVASQAGLSQGGHTAMLPSHPPPSHTLPLDHLNVLSGMTMAILSSPSVFISLLLPVTVQFPLFH